MIRTFVLATALAAGGLAALPATASAGDLTIGVGVSPVGYYGDRYYGGGYRPAYDRGYRHRWRDSRPRYGYGYGFYRPRAYYSYRPAPRCRVVTVRSWNGDRYVTRTRETCGRRSYRY